MKAKVKIGDKEINLLASVWTWIEYKRIFGRCWQSDRNLQDKKIQESAFFMSEYLELDDVGFSKLPKEKQEVYWNHIENNSLDTTFLLDTIYAMAVAGGFIGTRKDLFANMSTDELDEESELMIEYSKLIDEFFPVMKKKT